MHPYIIGGIALLPCAAGAAVVAPLVQGLLARHVLAESLSRVLVLISGLSRVPSEWQLLIQPTPDCGMSAILSYRRVGVHGPRP